MKYFLSENNAVCSDLGSMTIETLEECRSVPNWNFKEEQTVENYPKGCYYYKASGNLYWNKHQAGARNDAARQVCIHSGM